MRVNKSSNENASIKYAVFASVVISLCQVGQAQDSQHTPDALLRTAVKYVSSARGSVQLYQPTDGCNLPGRHFVPIRGLDNPQTVPFLIGVLEHGPEWSDKEGVPDRRSRYVARCYAALCLGAIGDQRALETLLVALRQGAPFDGGDLMPHRREDVCDVRRCAVFALGELGDSRAIEPLTTALRENKWHECIYALAKLEASQTAELIIQVASEKGYYCGEIHRALQFMLKTDFVIGKEGPGRFRIREFPGLGSSNGGDVYRILWEHWLKEGRRYAEEQFRKYYAEWKTALKEDPRNHSRHDALRRAMLKGGVVALPYLVDAVDHGDKSLAPVVFELIRSRRPQKREATGVKLREDLVERVESREWWKKQAAMILQGAPDNEKSPDQNPSKGRKARN